MLPAVYRHAATPESTVAMLWAAVLWTGGDGALSHTTAGALWRLDGVRLGTIELVVPLTRAPASPRIVVHRTSALRTVDVRMIDGLPLTAPARTLLDLAGVLDDRALESAVVSALARGLVTPSDLSALLAASGPGRAGAARFRQLLRQIPPGKRSPRAPERPMR